jgi:hypothetical protein
MTFYDAFAVAAGLTLIGMYLANRWRDVQYVTSDVDNRSYLVKKKDDSMEAANLLARLNDTVQRLIVHLLEKYPDDERVLLLDQRYNPDALSEGTNDTGYTSYSINKGERIIMCLRSRDEVATLENENTLVYVLVHELAHLATAEIGHTKTFWKNFRFFIMEAVSLGVYEDTDYSDTPVNYCGIEINSSSMTR